MSLSCTINPDRCSEGKDKFKENNEKLKKRFEEIKEKYAQKPHPAFGEVDGKEYHCAYNNYGIGCHDFTHDLPKGTPRQAMMDTLFHELENTPPVDELNDLFYEMETYVGAQALAAKEKIVNKLKDMAKQAGDKVKELVKGPSQANEANKEFSWVEELFDLFVDLFTGEISLTTIVRVLVNILKVSLKLMWKYIKQVYEPYLNTIMLIIWWVNTITQFVALVAKRLEKVVELLQRAANFQIRIPKDTAARKYMHIPAQSEPSLIVRNIVLDYDSKSALQQAQEASNKVNQEVNNLQDLQSYVQAEVRNAKSKQELKNTEAALAQNVSSVLNSAIANVMNALGVQDALVSLGQGVGSMAEALSKLAKVTAMAANVDQMIDKLCDAIFGVLDKILSAIGEVADSAGLGWLI